MEARRRSGGHGEREEGAMAMAVVCDCVTRDFYSLWGYGCFLLINKIIIINSLIINNVRSEKRKTDVKSRVTQSHSQPQGNRRKQRVTDDEFYKGKDVFILVFNY
jgi:hypothetical protein